MANKYIRHGETYCGDGTTSAAAASDGAVGAWNNINVFEGTAPAYGALAAGDTVYIRSKDAAGSNITRTISANTNIGSVSATATAPITWIIDNGAVWSGIDGVLKYVRSPSHINLTVKANNHIIATSQDALFFDDSAYDWPGGDFLKVEGYVKNARLVSADTVSAFAAIVGAAPYNKPAVLENLNVTLARCVESRILAGPLLRLINPSIEITLVQSGQFLFKVESDWGPSQLEVFGGKVFGAGAASNATVVYVRETVGGYASTTVLIYGTQIPRSMPFSNYGHGRNGRIEAVGLDGGIGSHFEEIWGWATSRTDNNPPVLEATLPDSSQTKWAWRVYPRAADYQKPVRLPSLKMYTGTAATKTVTLEFLLANTMSANKKSVWATIQYTDNATGEPKSVSTQDYTAPSLASSSANWSATTWGMITLTKQKLEVTTPTAIKQDTPVIVTFYCAVRSGSDQDILFVDSDFALT